MKSTILLLATLMSTSSIAGTAEDIKAVVEANFKHTQAEDVNASVATMHTDSPNYQATKQVLGQLFSVYDLKYTLVSFDFVGEDSDFAYARVKQLTEKVTGPAFQNNELESLQVFKRENGQWKLWTQANLIVNLVN